MFNRKEQGFILVLIPILIIAVIVFIVIFNSRQNNKIKIVPKIVYTALPSPTQSGSPSPSPLPTNSPSPIPSPAPIPTRSPSPRPATPKPVSGPPNSGYSRITVATEKGNFAASVLSIDLNSARMITDTGNDSDCATNCTTLSLGDYINRNGGFAGVNGSYFCPSTYPECASKTNSYDFPVWNTRVNHWINGSNLGWNSRAIFYTDGSGAHYNQNASGFSGGVNAGVVNFPGLLDNGNVQIDDNQSGLSDKQKSVGTKMGIGLIDSKHVLVVMASSVNMNQFAYVFKALGAKGALNLDTGGSTALYYNGKYLAGPGRAIPNAIIFAK